MVVMCSGMVFVCGCRLLVIVLRLFSVVVVVLVSC